MITRALQSLEAKVSQCERCLAQADAKDIEGREARGDLAATGVDYRQI